MYRFNNSKARLQTSCEDFDVTNNSSDEILEIFTSIQTIANATGVDPRFVFAIMMEESGGCVRAPTTNGGVRNPGLLQDHNGTGTCNENGVIQNPCPSTEISQMVYDGTAGTQSGDGLAQCLAETNVSDVSMYYKAARIYNSGFIDPTNLGAGGSNHCYASDIANRLIGWSAGPSGCDASVIGNLDGSSQQLSTMSSSATFTQRMDPQRMRSTIPASQVTQASTIDTGSGSYIPPQTPCTAEGMWNCLNGTSTQRCASGRWSAVQLLAAGMSCVGGQATIIELEESK